MLELEYESKIIKKLLVIKEICFWLQTFRSSNPGGLLCYLLSSLWWRATTINTPMSLVESSMRCEPSEDDVGDRQR